VVDPSADGLLKAIDLGSPPTGGLVGAQKVREGWKKNLADVKIVNADD